MVSVRYQADPDEFAASIEAKGKLVAEAATNAFRELGEIVKKNGRANIASAGFSVKWQNALRITVYPERGVTTSPSVYITHNIRYARIFETGGTISGKGGLLWLPLKNIQGQYTGIAARRGSYRLTPWRIGDALSRNVLFPIKGTKLLGIKIYVPQSQASSPVSPVTKDVLAKAIRTKANKRRKPQPGKVLKTVPVFHGVSSVTIRKRFNLFAGFRRDAQFFPALYLKNFKG